MEHYWPILFPAILSAVLILAHTIHGAFKRPEL